MTTKELESKLKISENTCIHCSTLELAKQVLNIFHKLGLKWRNGIYYTKCTDWDNYKENTIYYPTAGTFSGLQFAQEEGYKIISAEEFIALHTEKEEFDLETYEPKGELIGFPKEIIAKMLDYQEEQRNKRDISVFEKSSSAGFTWNQTKESWGFWYKVIKEKNFDLFFKKYPKQDNQDNSKEFRVGDKVIDFISGQIGKVTKIDTLNNDSYSILVDFNNNEIARFTLDGRYYGIDKHPRLLHYRDDYNYDVIDFNNLPKRQEPKRWRAEEGESYHFVSFDKRCWFYSNGAKDDYASFDNNNYNSGNYFRTEVEAEIIAQELNSYFKQLIKGEHEHERN